MTNVERDDSHLSDLERDAIALCGIPGWYPWIFLKIQNGVLCTGAVCPPIANGPRKGQPNYRKADQKTKSSIVLPLRAPPT